MTVLLIIETLFCRRRCQLHAIRRKRLMSHALHVLLCYSPQAVRVACYIMLYGSRRSSSTTALLTFCLFSSFLLHHTLFYYYFVFAFTVKLGNTDYRALCYAICSLGRYYALLHPLGGPIILKIRWRILDVNCHWGLGNLCYVLALLVLDWYFAFPYLLWSLTGILIF